MRLIQDMRINYIYLQVDFLLLRNVMPILPLSYSTNYHLRISGLKMVFKSALRKYLLTHLFSNEEYLSNDQRSFIFGRVLSPYQLLQFFYTEYILNSCIHIFYLYVRPIIYLLSLRHVQCIYSYLIRFLTKLY